MAFVQRLYNITSIFIGLLCLALLFNTAYAKTTPPTKILIWGDSLSASYRIPIEKGWVSLLQKKLGNEYEIINGSISGETSQGGLSRFPDALETHKPDFVILELGANDGLRGIIPKVTKNNLEQMILKAKEANAEVVLFGIKIPPNYGPLFSKQFEAQFVELAENYLLPFIPFFLEPIVQDMTFFQADRLHPTAEAQPLILDYILPTLNDALGIEPEKKETKATLKNPA